MSVHFLIAIVNPFYFSSTFILLTPNFASSTVRIVDALVLSGETAGQGKTGKNVVIVLLIIAFLLHQSMA